MKVLLAAVLTLIAASAPANEVEMILVPKASAEMLVRENLERQSDQDRLVDIIKEQNKRIHQLQNSTNCV